MSSGLVGGGQFIGPSSTPLGSGLARVLGLQGGQLGGVAADVGGVIPVAVVADTSDSVNRALIPRKFFSGRVTAPGAGNVVRLLFLSNPAAASIIERFRFEGATALANPIGFGTSAVNIAIGLGAFIVTGAAEVGGQVPGSVTFNGWGPQTQIGVPTGFGVVKVPPDTFDFTEREWFIGAGGSFLVESADANVAIRWSIQWREVPE